MHQSELFSGQVIQYWVDLKSEKKTVCSFSNLMHTDLYKAQVVVCAQRKTKRDLQGIHYVLIRNGAISPPCGRTENDHHYTIP